MQQAPTASGALAGRRPLEVSTLGSAVRSAAAALAAAGVGPARLEAEVLAASVLGCPRGQLPLRLRDSAPAGVDRSLRGLVARRAAGEPLQYLTGVQEFWSLEFRVDARVLIPRPETEGIVEQALRQVTTPAPRVLDVGTGSGCIAVALAHELPGARVVGADASRGALEVARDNARRLLPGRRIDWVQADLLTGLRGRFDLIVSNPPYVASSEVADLPRDVRDHEPRSALVAGTTGLEVLERLARGAAGLLAPAGALLMEIGAGQWEPMAARLRAAGAWQEAQAFADFQGIPRVVLARPLPAGEQG